MAAAVQFKQVSKRYRIGHRLSSLRSLFGKGENSQDQHHWAVKDVTFDLQPGEALGILGPNGAGKTTILKLLSSITRPTSGQLEINGRLSALIELGAGFHPDLTGRENVFLNGAILGMRKAEIQDRFDRIIDFAGIGDYLDTPVKRYSSGMYARLGFAIAAHVDPDIMLVDEVLAVGDYAFRMKCYERMHELRRAGTSLIFVSHNLEDINRVCDRGLVMVRGQKAYLGTVAEAVAEYSSILRQSTSAKPGAIHGSGGLSQRVMTHGARIERVELIGEDGSSTKTVHSGESATLVVEFQCFEDVAHPICACIIRSATGEVVYDTTTQLLDVETPVYRAGERGVIQYKLDMHLLNGVYSLSTDLAYADLTCYYDYFADALNFVVTGSSASRGVVNLGAEISFDRLSSTISELHLNQANGKVQAQNV
ncbi:MAG: ABC transporter ATP-binding protein [Caldilineaceae bacterium]|nr:ABC transporter ATP-binding protein [Caldilineaceae bacterium]